MEYAYAVSNAAPHATSFSQIDSILQASLVVQLVLLLLITASVLCWGVIFAKAKQMSSMAASNEDFLDHFWKAASLDEVYKKLDRYKPSSVAHVFRSGFVELQRIAESSMKQSGAATPAKLTGIDNLVRALRKATDNEIAAMEHRLNFLATTGSTGPFIGLFGTVWGIMNAFQRIAQTGAASLSVVAPGISEALITTAIGLVAAIPAVVAYNHFISNVKKEELELSNFTTDFLNLVKRDFFKDE